MATTERLNDAFPTWFNGGGIFTALQGLSPGVPWKSLNIDRYLDLEYHGNISGQKIVSPLVRSIQAGSALSQNEMTQLATILASINSVSWAKEYATLSAQYSPLENYDMTEVMTNDQTATVFGHSNTRTNNLTHAKTGTEQQSPNTTDTRTANLTHAKTGTEEQAPNTTDTRTANLTHGKTGTEEQAPLTTQTTTPAVTQTTNIRGFNSSVDVPAGSQVSSGTNTVAMTGTDTLTFNTAETDTGTDTTVRTGTDTLTFNTAETDTGTDTTVRTGTDTLTYNTSDTDTGTQTDAESGTNTQTRNYTLTRSGNIGVTTSQQMLESERAAWLWNFFRDVVFPDVDRVLTIPIY